MSLNVDLVRFYTCASYFLLGRDFFAVSGSKWSVWSLLEGVVRVIIKTLPLPGSKLRHSNVSSQAQQSRFHRFAKTPAKMGRDGWWHSRYLLHAVPISRTSKKDLMSRVTSEFN